MVERTRHDSTLWMNLDNLHHWLDCRRVAGALSPYRLGSGLRGMKREPGCKK